MVSSGKLNKVYSNKEDGIDELPSGYGKTEIMLLPRDPNWMFAYWEITRDSLDRIKSERGNKISSASQIIRVYSGDKNVKCFDVPVMFEAGNWYINVRESGNSYYCEIGLLCDGEFISLAKSNTVKLPSGKVSDATDEKWMSVTPDFEKLLQLSGIEYIGKGSGEVAKTLAQRWEMLRAVFSRAASWGISSVSAIKHDRKDKKFWLVADCEIILYGATEPDAKVTVSGRDIKLNPDGTFSMRFALPDGSLKLPVRAFSKNGEKKGIEIRVSRTTKQNGK